MNRSRGILLLLIAALAVAMAFPTPASARRSAHPSQPQRTHYHFDSIPVRSALQVLAEDGGFNLVVSDTVTGTVSLHLDNVTWEQALAVVLRLKGLDQRVIGNSRVVAAR